MCVWESSLELSDLAVEAEGPPDKRRREEEEDDVDLSKGEERADALAKQHLGIYYTIIIYSSHREFNLVKIKVIKINQK